MTTDASDKGLGAVLQHKSGSELHTVAFASRTSSPTEKKKYSTVERETLAYVFACGHWHIYLWAHHFVLRTDHQALVTLLASNRSGHRLLRISRLSARLLYYNFDIEFQRGADNWVADVLSRLPIESHPVQEKEEEIVSIVISCVTKKQLQVVTIADGTLQNVLDFVTKKWPPLKSLAAKLLPFYHVREDLSVFDNHLLRDNKVVILAALTPVLVRSAH